MPRKKRGRKRAIKLRIKGESLRSVFSISLLGGAGIILVSFFAPDYVVNSYIQNAVRGTFGFASILIPPILTVWGLLFIRSIKSNYVDVRVLFGLVGMLIGFSGLFHIFYDSSEALDLAREGVGGGIVGYQIDQILRNTISVYGGFLFLLAVIIISGIFVLDLSFDEMFEKVAAIKGKAPSLKKKGEGDEDSDEGTDDEISEEIKISTGAEAMLAKDKDMELVEAVEDLPEPSMEVVPSMSEPQSNSKDDLPEPAETGNVVSLAPGLPYSDKVWEVPPLELLNEPSNAPVDRGDVKQRAKMIEETLESFGISTKVVEVNYGPTVTRYALEVGSGTKTTKISSHQYDLALALASPTGSVRIEAPIPGKSLIGIEVPNNTRTNVSFKEVYTSDAMKGIKSKLGVVLGKDVGGQTYVYDISKMPHLLVAGATGSGKSVFLHNIMFSILYKCSPAECKFILIDPKRVELVHYQDIPHLYSPVVTDIEKAPAVFKWAVDEMMRRYKLFESAKARNIESYNEKSGFQALPYICIVVDELAEIMVTDPASVEKSIIRIAQLARATGIHLILSTQRPSTNVVTGLIKANIPCRVAFNVTSNIDSRVIIDQPGAEKLMGKGDMLFVPPDVSKPIRIQGSNVTDDEINKLVSYLKSSGAPPEYKEEILTVPVKEKSVSAGGEATDDLFDEAVDVVVTAGKASASLLQRRLSIGYARAARILDELEAEGIVGPANGSKPREVLREASTFNPELPDDLPTAPLEQNF